MAANPPTPIGVMAASVPPQIITSACAALDELERIADRVRGSGAGRSGGGIWAARAVANRNDARREIDDCGRNEKRRDVPRAALQQLPVFAFDDVEPADARGNVDADFVEIGFGFLSSSPC